MCVSVSPTCMCTTWCLEGPEEVVDTLELELHTFEPTCWTLGAEPRFSIGRVNILNHRVIALAPTMGILGLPSE